MTAIPSGQPDRRASAALQWLYLLLAVAGAVLPWLANLEFIQAYGATGDLGLFVRLAHDNPAASSLSRDLAIGATAVLIWIVSESRRLQMRGLVWVLLCCFTLAFACGAPLFLFLRERRLAELAEQSPAWPGLSAAPPHGESAEHTAEQAQT